MSSADSPDDEATTWRSTSTDELRPGALHRLPAPSRRSAGFGHRCELVCGRAAEQDPELGWPLRCIDALRELPDDLARGPGRPRPKKENTVSSGQAVRRLVRRPECEEPRACFHRQASLCLFVRHDQFAVTVGGAPTDEACAASSGAWRTSRFRSTTRDTARARLLTWYLTVPMTSTGRHRSTFRPSVGSGRPERRRSLVARKLREDAALRNRHELAQRDLLALVDRPGSNLRGQRRRARDGARDDRAPRHRLRLEISPSRDRRPVGAGRECRVSPPAPSRGRAMGHAVSVADHVEADEDRGERGQADGRARFRIRDFVSREIPFAPIGRVR